VAVPMPASEPESIKKYASEYRYHDAVHGSSAVNKEPLRSVVVSALADVNLNSVALADAYLNDDTDTPMAMIPHNIIFAYKTNVMEQKRLIQFYENVLHTIEMYKGAWKTRDSSSGGANYTGGVSA
jgi:hypothetical protein